MLSVFWAVIAALASAACAAVSSALQHRSAGLAPPGRGLGLGLLLHLARRPVWLAGLLAAGVAFALHGLALSGGNLIVVQPILVSGILFALPVSALLHSRRPSALEWVWALVLILGLSAFLLASGASEGTRLPQAGRLAVLTIGGSALMAAVILWGIGPARRFRALCFGAATGISYGMAAGLLKYCVALLALDPHRLFTGWPLYALILMGAAGVVLNQAAYQAGPLAGSLPFLTIANPVTAIVIGTVAYGEALNWSVLGVAGQAVGVVLSTVAIIQLARRGGDPDPDVPAAGSGAGARGSESMKPVLADEVDAEVLEVKGP